MNIAGPALHGLLSPMVLFFVVGLVAGLLKSDLEIPRSVSKSMSLYLMMAIGFKGGVELSQVGLTGTVAAAALIAIAMSLLLPVLAYALLRATSRLDTVNAAAVAAHYGSVSVVTFAVAIAVLSESAESFEAYLVGMLVLMEAPAIVTGLYLARRGDPGVTTQGGGFLRMLGAMMREGLLSGTVLLLLGSLMVGAVTGEQGMRDIGALFDKPYKGVLCIFLLEMGVLVSQRLPDLRAVGWPVALFGLYMPLIGGGVGLGAAWLLGLSAGGATLLAVLGASASYIVVPAAMRVSLPQASPAIYLTLSLGITFPFNLFFGITLYHEAARLLVT